MTMPELSFNYFERPIPKRIFDWDYISRVVCRGEIFTEYLLGKIFNNRDLLCLIVASLGDDIVGVAVISTGTGTGTEQHAFIDLVCAKRQPEVSGVGSIMLARAEEYVQEKGFTVVNLHALTEELATGFYTRHGYKRCDIDEIDCSRVRHCHKSLRWLGKYDSEGGWEGYSMTKCLPRSLKRKADDVDDERKRVRYLSSRVDDMERYLSTINSPWHHSP